MRAALFAVTALLICLSKPGLAEAPDCAGDDRYRDFDFWLGHWQVHDPEGQLRGHNEITVIAGGCALREHWRSAAGGSGQSLNYFDPATGLWHQLWVDSGGHIIDLRGATEEEGDILLTGTIRYPGDPEPKAFRGRWSPLEDGRVRQFFEQRDDAGQWQTWFEGFYSASGQVVSETAQRR